MFKEKNEEPWISIRTDLPKVGEIVEGQVGYDASGLRINTSIGQIQLISIDENDGPWFKTFPAGFICNPTHWRTYAVDKSLENEALTETVVSAKVEELLEHIENMTLQDIRLMCGELTAQEMRTAKAILFWIAKRFRKTIEE